MNDRPDAGELLRAVERFLESDVVPVLDGVQRFHARVAANVVAIVARELETEELHLRSEWEGLSRLLEDASPLPETRSAQRAGLVRRNEELVRRIRAGLTWCSPTARFTPFPTRSAKTSSRPSAM